MDLRCPDGMEDVENADTWNAIPARIELPADRIEPFLNSDLLPDVTAHLKQLGFTWVTIDLLGFRSGSLNEVLVSSEG